MIFNANLQHLVKHFPIFVELLHNFKLKITFNSQTHQFNNRLKYIQPHKLTIITWTDIHI